MADVHPDHAQLQADRIYLGWQYLLLHPDPGPPPKRPSPAEENEPGKGGTDAEKQSELLRRERLQEDMLNRPVRLVRLFMLMLTTLHAHAGLHRLSRLVRSRSSACWRPAAWRSSAVTPCCRATGR